MGALQQFWKDSTVDAHSKYLILCDISLNLLLWGCESWALRESSMTKLQVFSHQSICRILGITITQVIDEHISNKAIQIRVNNIPTVRN